MFDPTGGPCLRKRVSGCGAGLEYVAVTPDGDLYPCHQFVGRDEYKLGNVFEGIKKPELPVIHFPAPARDAGMAQTGAAGCIETLLDTGTPEWEPKTKLDHLSVDILSQLEQLMGT